MKVHDTLGNEVPHRLWNQFAAVRRARRKMSNIRDRFRELLMIGDFVDDPAPLLQQMSELQDAVRSNWPHSICPQHTNDGFCPTCESKGYLTYDEFRQNHPR